MVGCLDRGLTGGWYDPCSVGDGRGGLGRGGAGPLAKNFLLESCERPRMEKVGEYDNRLSRNAANKMAGASA